jgi:hypothetical protein
MADFFRAWKQTEDRILLPAGVRVDYALYDGRFTRTIAAPTDGADAGALAEALSAYIRMFDRCMKNTLTGRYGTAELQREYLNYLDGVGLYL